MMLKALAIAQDIASGTMTAEDALELGDAAINAREGELGVFQTLATDKHPGTGPLAGIAVGVKDIFDTVDLPTEYNSPIYSSHQPVADASLVSMLRGAGGTVAGKTVTTEFAWFSPGRTRNPVNPDHTPGGSSSGSAAGVAAGFFPAAIGTQTGGSIIRPAAFCGVTGYKPSFRLFPTVGVKCFSWSLDTVGFFAARVADVAFVAAACSGRDLIVDDGQTNPPAIASLPMPIDLHMSADMETALDTATALADAPRAEPDPAIIDATLQAHPVIQDYEACLSLAFERQHHRAMLSPRLRDYLDEASTITPDAYDDARRLANKARKAAHDLFADADILMLPSAPGAAPPGLESTGDSIFNRSVTLLGLPSLSIAGFTDPSGMPLGIQLIARFGQDKALLQAGHWLERRIAEHFS